MKKIKHFLDLNQINAQELRSIVDLSKSYKQGITSSQDTHKGKTLGLIFEKPSTRTRVSFEIAMYQLGGNVTILEHEKTHLGRGETISDTAKVLARYINSQTPRTETRELSFNIAINWLPVGGTMMGTAWGRITLRMIRLNLKPRALEASH